MEAQPIGKKSVKEHDMPSLIVTFSRLPLQCQDLADMNTLNR